MSGRLEKIFEACITGRSALICYLTAGDPDCARSLDYFRALFLGGADIVEIGVPFSDPIADGPVIQAATGRALAAGTTIDDVVRLVEALRKEFPDRGIVVMSYLNPLLSAGPDIFLRLQTAGADALLPTDLAPADDARMIPGLRAAGLDRIVLLSDSTPLARRQANAVIGSGFAYYIARRGVTGERSGLQETLFADLAALAAAIKLPIAVGFGLSNPADIAAIAGRADGVIVGSALVRMVSERASPEALSARVAELRAACKTR